MMQMMKLRMFFSSTRIQSETIMLQCAEINQFLQGFPAAAAAAAAWDEITSAVQQMNRRLSGPTKHCVFVFMCFYL